MNDLRPGEELQLRTLVPFAGEECVSIGMAATLAGKSERTLRNWCVEHGIGRRVAGGTWAVSRVALAMLLEDDMDALAAYRDGAQAQYEPVASYYRRLGLGGLLRGCECFDRFAGCGGLRL